MNDDVIKYADLTKLIESLNKNNNKIVEKNNLGVIKKIERKGNKIIEWDSVGAKKKTIEIYDNLIIEKDGLGTITKKIEKKGNKIIEWKGFIIIKETMLGV